MLITGLPVTCIDKGEIVEGGKVHDSINIKGIPPVVEICEAPEGIHTFMLSLVTAPRSVQVGVATDPINFMKGTRVVLDLDYGLPA